MHTVEMFGKEFDLAAIENDCWQRITNGAAKHRDTFHYTTVANVNQHGVNIRVVVLRDADSNKKQLVFHTDSRSGKWQELAANNNISFLFYHPDDKIQIRLAGTADLYQSDAVAENAWAGCSNSTRKTYMGATAPSSISAAPTSGLPVFDSETPTPEQIELGRKNFGVVITTINWMEWVWLNNNGNRRAAFHYTDGGLSNANWLVP